MISRDFFPEHKTLKKRRNFTNSVIYHDQKFKKPPNDRHNELEVARILIENDVKISNSCALALHCVTGTFLDGCFKGCGMGPWLVLVSPCFRENVVSTYKIGSFLSSLDNLPQKNVIVLFFWKSNFKMSLIWKKGYFWPAFHIFYSHREKLQKFLQHISQTHTYTYFAHPINFFCLTSFEIKYEFIRYSFSLVWVLVLILIRAILEQSINNKMVSKI